MDIPTTSIVHTLCPEQVIDVAADDPFRKAFRRKLKSANLRAAFGSAFLPSNAVRARFFAITKFTRVRPAMPSDRTQPKR